ncbi:APC family permease [Agromyces aerolatus]|uniref:APC family permease n=1 Tax=Agromyces sp. LY-1074 TaxID=3074080 RepID=UPI00286553D0|nr:MULTISPECIES: APC family permease [unclassified Agromyces]MDR5700431.1 APC family permease [Agromyces sp. LY-1074]MDR5706952.1 APC family permease [Agromyces sp. LY-1358]
MSANAVTPAPPEAPGRSLKGSLGAISVTFMVIAAAAPLTVVGGIVPIGFLLGNGIGFPVMFLAATVILLLFSVGLTTMSRYVPRAGSFFTFVTHGLGRTPGLATAYLALVCYTTVQIAVFSYLGGTLSSSIVLLGGPEIAWWLFTLVSMAIVGVLGYRRIELSSRVLVVVLIAEMGIVLLLGLVILVTGGADGVTTGSFLLENILSGSPALGLMFAIASFIGFESTVVYRDEVRDPDRTIPRATYASAIVIGLFYAFAAWTIVVGLGEGGVIDEAAADPATLVARVTEQYLGPVGAIAVAVLFLGSMFAAVLSLHNVLTRYHHSMANARVLPDRLGVVHGRHGSPHLASVVQVSTVAVLLVLLTVIGFTPENIFAWFAGIGTLAIVILMAFTCLAVIVYFARTRVLRSPWHTLIAPGLGFVGLAVAAALIAANFPLLVSDVDADGNPAWGAISITLVAIVVLAPIVGLVQALIMRSRKPEAYAQITRRFDEAE